MDDKKQGAFSMKVRTTNMPGAAVSAFMLMGSLVAWSQGLHVPPPPSIFSVAWSPDGTRLATGSNDSTTKIWDIKTGRELLRVNGPRGSVLSIAWSPDDKRVATGSVGGSAKVWDSQTGKELVSLNKYDVHSVSWSPDGKRLAMGGEDATASVWDAADGKRLLVLGGRTGQVSSVAWSPDVSLAN